MLQPGYSCCALLQPQHPVLALLISQIKVVNSPRMTKEKPGKTARRTLQELQQKTQQPKLSSKITRLISSHAAISFIIKTATDIRLSDIRFNLDSPNDTQMLHHHKEITPTVRQTKQVQVKPPVILEPFKNIFIHQQDSEILMTLVQDMYCVYLSLFFF